MTTPTPDPIATLRERHRPIDIGGPETPFVVCSRDEGLWPCDAERFRQALDAALAALRDARIGLVSEHGHDVDFGAPWPACLPIHIALNRATALLADPTPSDEPVTEGSGRG